MKLNMSEPKYPNIKVQMVGKDGNAFSIIGRVTKALRNARVPLEERKKFQNYKEMYDKEHKLRQEAEGELTILKGIETNRVKEAQEALANSLEVNESHQKLNGKLQMRITELEEDNKKLSHQIEDRVNKMRKSGM